jgi:hypothetical protein
LESDLLSVRGCTRILFLCIDETVYVGLMVLFVVKLHDFLADVRLEGIVIVRKRGKSLATIRNLSDNIRALCRRLTRDMVGIRSWDGGVASDGRNSELLGLRH